MDWWFDDEDWKLIKEALGWYGREDWSGDKTDTKRLDELFDRVSAMIKSWEDE